MPRPKHRVPEVEAWISAAEAQGYTAAKRPGGHWRVSRDKEACHFAATPRKDRRTLLNIRAQMRRIGVDLP